MEVLKRKQETITNTREVDYKSKFDGQKNLKSQSKMKQRETEKVTSYENEDVDDEVGEKKRKAYLDVLFETAKSGGPLNGNEVRDQVTDMLFVGHTATCALHSFFLCVMGARLDLQEKVVEELEKIFGDSDRPITYEDTVEMKFMERCLMETLRLFPPVPLITRELKEEVQLKSTDLILPANSTVVIATCKLQRNHAIYPNPDVFDPDNFLPERVSSRHYYACSGFSGGPRGCIGRKYAMLEAKMTLATILRHYKVYSSKKIEDWKLKADITLKRADGFNIRVEPRQMRPKPATLSKEDS